MKVTRTTSNGEHTHHVAITGNGNPGAPGLTAANSLRTAASGGGSEGGTTCPDG